MIGECRLCRQERVLRSSHLMPKALFRLLRDGENCNPIVTSKAISRETSEQVTQHLLCDECEGRFSRQGESHVLRNCWRKGSGFYLRDNLNEENRLILHNEVSVHDTRSIPHIKVDHFTYFAVSLVWRMAAAIWRDQQGVFLGTSLGPYLEPIRKYLLGVAELPETVTVFVHVSSEKIPDNIATTPMMTRQNCVTRHKFYVPGLLFAVFVGKNFSRKMTSLSTEGMVWLCPFRSDGLSKKLARMCQEATETGKLKGRERGTR